MAFRTRWVSANSIEFGVARQDRISPRQGHGQLHAGFQRMCLHGLAYAGDDIGQTRLAVVDDDIVR